MRVAGGRKMIQLLRTIDRAVAAAVAMSLVAGLAFVWSTTATNDEIYPALILPSFGSSASSDNQPPPVIRIVTLSTTVDLLPAEFFHDAPASASANLLVNAENGHLETAVRGWLHARAGEFAPTDECVESVMLNASSTNATHLRFACAD